MEKLTPQSVKQQEYLKGQKSWFQEMAENLPTTGWVEGQIQNRPSLQTWAQGLQLTNLTPEDYFDRLARVIIPLQQSLIGETLPTIDERLKKLEAGEIERIRKLRDNFNLDPLYPPIRNYSGILQTREMQDFLNKSRSRRLFEAFLGSRGANRIFNAIVNFSRSNLEKHYFDASLSGAIIEEIGHPYSNSLNRNADTTILSPEETDILYKNIYSDKFKLVDPFGLNYGVEGINVPDGLVINYSGEFLNIVLIVEYKSLGQNNYDISYIKTQRESYTPEHVEENLRLKNHHPLDPSDLGRLIHAIRPSLPEKPVRISPKLMPLYVIPRGTNLSMNGILIEELPVSTSAIHALAQELKRVQLLRKNN